MAENDYTELYEDKAGEYRWRRKAGNHEIIAVSGESFYSKASASRSAKRVFPTVASDVPVWPLVLITFVVGVVVGTLLGAWAFSA